jgi:hypothetical protein
MKFNILLVLEAIREARRNGQSYTEFENHPVDTRNKTYPLWYRWLKEKGKIKCFGCGREAHYMKLKKCKGAGSIHKESGEQKHFFQLVSVNTHGDEMPFTLDHWIPRSFLNKLSQLFDYSIKDNLVPMCACCNSQKQDRLPKNFKWGVTKHKPELLILNNK